MFPAPTFSPASATLRRTVAAGLAAVALATGVLAGAPAAEAKNGRNAALIGGLAAGALIGGVIASEAARAPSYSYGYAPGYGYGYDNGYAYAPQPRALYPSSGYVPAGRYYAQETYVRECYRERRPVYDAWGDVVGFRKVRVCN